MYWRVSFSPDGTVMECRKVDGAGADILGFDGSCRGEAWHSDDGLRGGLMRECGFPGWQLTGLETFGILGFKGVPTTGWPPPPGDKAFGTFMSPIATIFCSKVDDPSNPPPDPPPSSTVRKYTTGTSPTYGSRHLTFYGPPRPRRLIPPSRSGSQRSLWGCLSARL
jgi:hypothetical protein